MFEIIEISNYYRKNFMKKVIVIPNLFYEKEFIDKSMLDNSKWPFPGDVYSMKIVKL